MKAVTRGFILFFIITLFIASNLFADEPPLPSEEEAIKTASDVLSFIKEKNISGLMKKISLPFELWGNLGEYGGVEKCVIKVGSVSKKKGELKRLLHCLMVSQCLMSAISDPYNQDPDAGLLNKDFQDRYTVIKASEIPEDIEVFKRRAVFLPRYFRLVWVQLDEGEPPCRFHLLIGTLKDGKRTKIGFIWSMIANGPGEVY